MKKIILYTLALLYSTTPLTALQLHSSKSMLEKKVHDLLSIRQRLYLFTQLPAYTNENPALCCDKYISASKLNRDPFLALEFIIRKINEAQQLALHNKDSAKSKWALAECEELRKTVYSTGLMNYIARTIAFEITNTSSAYIVTVCDYIEQHANHFHGNSRKTAIQLAHYRPGTTNNQLPPVTGGIFTPKDLAFIKHKVAELSGKIHTNLMRLNWLRPQVGVLDAISRADTNLLTLNNIIAWLEAASTPEENLVGNQFSYFAQ